MDRRQKKTRQAIFKALLLLLDKKDFSRITVQEILDAADVGRATFYAHFETKEYLLKELCRELFDHVLEATAGREDPTGRYAACHEGGSVFGHLLHHLQRNDDGMLLLLSCRNNELFLKYFKENLARVLLQNHMVPVGGPDDPPKDLVLQHITATFVEVVFWWVRNGMTESPEQVEGYVLALLGMA